MECPTEEVNEYFFSSNAIPPYGIALLFLGAIGLVLLGLLQFWLLPSFRKSSQEDLLSHVVITGGSSGIGLALAKECIEKGSTKIVTILARNPEKLTRAKAELEASGKSTVIQTFAVDVSDATKIAEVAKEICKGPIVPTALLNVAGTATAASFTETDYSEFQRLMEINYLGSAYATRAFLPYMLEDSKGIHPRAIIFTSSQVGQLGVYGFTAYAASKFALRGLAEALHMEVLHKNVSVQVVFPPDTDTPGFELENIGKPKVTKVLSETSGLFSPEAVAKTILRSLLKRRPPFHVCIGLDGFMLGTLTGGMSPAINILDTIYQIFLSGLFRFVSLFYLWDFHRTVRTVEAEEKAK